MTGPGKITVTFFDHYTARFKRQQEHTLAELAKMIEDTTGESKNALPWVKLATFGNAVTEKRCLRHDANVESVTGCEADYDGEKIPVDEAKEKLEKIGVTALIYTSASHTPERPRYRILRPFSEKLEPKRRAQMVARLNGLFGGALSPESFVLSQAFYYGHILDADHNVVAHRKNGNGAIDVVPSECRVELIEAQPIDQRDELDRGAIGKAGGGIGGGEFHGGGDYTEIQELVRRITSGESLHPSVASIAGKYARQGWPIETCIELVGSAFTAAEQPRYGGRWQECITCISNIYRKEANRGDAGGSEKEEAETAEPPPDPQPQPEPEPPKTTVWKWHGIEPALDARRHLIDDLLLEEGTGLISGQWGYYKTFVGIDLGVSVMTGNPFIRFPVKRQGGVLWFACEGISEVPIRVTAAWEDRGGRGRAPFAWTGSCPPLLERDALPKLIEMIRSAAETMQRDFGLPVVLVIIDTLAKAAGLTKEGQLNDDTTAKIIIKKLSDLGAAVNAACVGIAHFGKDKERGTKGSSGFEDDSETVLAMLGERTIGGVINGPHAVLRKRKGEENGEEFPFTTRRKCIGKNAEGKEIWTLVLDWGKADESSAAKPKQQDAGWGKKSLRLLRAALMAVLAERGKQIKPRDDERTVRAVDLEIVRQEFYKSHPAAADSDADTRRKTREKAFKRAVEEAKDKLIGSREIEGVVYVWFIDPAQERPSPAAGDEP